MIWDVAQDLPNCSFYISNDRFPIRDISTQQIQEVVDVPYINVLRALICHWDLVVFVNHPWGFGSWFSPYISKIYINHGIWVGKINNDKQEDGVYGPSRVNRPFGKPLYNLMCCSSEYEKAQAEVINPQLKGRLKTIGYLRADSIETMNKDRLAIRKRLGYDESDRVVFILSTWGPDSLYQRYGNTIYQQIVQPKSNLKYILTLHPRYDEFGDKEKRKRIDILQSYSDIGAEIIDGLKWEAQLVASDVAISDHTSMSLYFYLLDKPVIFCNMPATSYVENSPFQHVYNSSLKFSVGDNINELVGSIFNEQSIPNTTPNAEIKKMLNSLPGESAEQLKTAFQSLL